MTLAAAWVLLAATAAAEPQPRTRAECEARHGASWGRPGKDVMWVPTQDGVVRAMLEVAKVTPRDFVLDLGAGDGKIAIAAARSFRARAVGVEYDARLARLAKCLVRVERVADKVHIVQGDIFKHDFGAATVVTMYLLPELNLCVRHRLLAMAPGTRVVSHQYGMGDWPPEESVTVLERDVHLWIVPARVDGIWNFRDSEGTTFAIDLRQTFGAISGEVERGGAREALVSASLRGVELRFTSNAGGEGVKFTGKVRGDEMVGVLSTSIADRAVRGRLRGARRGAPWAEMQPGCGRYYDR